ncbi:30S ribosomal protein S6 [Candidatus Beckwithbacteria bacterium RBG_13_42_9]|uniref:Small ribosomal subunit protein bS6 n=1 Tax=Candidatus Beckwithbacteria bacterium RBG_13_42_9 TaxID=1797457 RepID=A0A1F5E8M8_9BACT|nr:MAG: 30S ribosomal protein S6 [Candidatus Beckwithbacteria bacterium RBG_13_42_9]
MSKYEVTLLFDKDEKDAKKIAEAIFKSAKVKVVKEEDWKVKPLAYRIKGLDEAHYCLWQVEADPKQLPDLQNRITLEEKVVRNLVVKTK